MTNNSQPGSKDDRLNLIEKILKIVALVLAIIAAILGMKGYHDVQKTGEEIKNSNIVSIIQNNVDLQNELASLKQKEDAIFNNIENLEKRIEPKTSLIQTTPTINIEVANHAQLIRDRLFQLVERQDIILQKIDSLEQQISDFEYSPDEINLYVPERDNFFEKLWYSIKKIFTKRSKWKKERKQLNEFDKDAKKQKYDDRYKEIIAQIKDKKIVYKEPELDLESKNNGDLINTSTRDTLCEVDGYKLSEVIKHNWYRKETTKWKEEYNIHFDFLSGKNENLCYTNYFSYRTARGCEVFLFKVYKQIDEPGERMVFTCTNNKHIEFEMLFEYDTIDGICRTIYKEPYSEVTTIKYFTKEP